MEHHSIDTSPQKWLWRGSKGLCVHCRHWQWRWTLYQQMNLLWIQLRFGSVHFAAAMLLKGCLW